MGERQFTEQQVADIIRRASESQSRQVRPGDAPSGLIAASEVRRIAQELGIDSNAVDEAIEATSAWVTSDLGNATTVDRTFERRIEGELEDDDYSAVLEEFVPSSGPGSQSISVGSTLNYKAMVGLAECNVNVSRKSGWTHVRVKSSAFLALLPTMIPAFLATVVSGGAVWESKLPGVGEKLFLHLMIITFAWSLAIWGFRAAVRYSNRKIAGLLDRTAMKLSDLMGSQSPVRQNLAHEGLPEQEGQGLRVQD